MALLIALDDSSQNSGEVWRLRKAEHTIGRKQGDTVIPHDRNMSSEHARIRRRKEGARFHWYLSDLHSRNGTFLRTAQAVLKEGDEFLLGSRRYVVRVSESTAIPKGTRDETKKQEACLADLTGENGETVYPLRHEELWVGSDGSDCQIAVKNDPFIDLKHACLRKDHTGRWNIKDAGSLNGVWLRVKNVQLTQEAEFLLGEQRFLFKVLDAPENIAGETR